MAWALRSQLGPARGHQGHAGKVCVAPTIPAHRARGFVGGVVGGPALPPSPRRGRHLRESLEAGGVVTLRMPIWTGFLPACTRCEEGEVKVK